MSDNMKDIEELRVRWQNSRAKILGMPATLSLVEWKQTITDFKGLCAYCEDTPFEVLEHFIPIGIAGTTVHNCVPACYRCNYKKSDRAGDSLIEVLGQAKVDQISQYLASRCNVADVFIPKLIQRRPRWNTHPKRPLEIITPFIEEKQSYSIQELLYEHLTITLPALAEMSGVNVKSIYRVLYGEKVVRQSTVKKLLDSLSEIYKKQFTLDNVTGINLPIWDNGEPIGG